MPMSDVTGLLRECERRFGFRIVRAEPIPLGWLNAKWRLDTDAGPLVAKRYHPNRFRDEATLRLALEQMMRLCRSGIPCAELLESDGELLHLAEDGGSYIVMRYCEGERLDAGTASAARMEALGRVAGRMHRALNDGTLAPRAEPQFAPPSRERRLAHWDRVLEEASASGRSQAIPLIEQQRRATERLDAQRLRERCVPGWAHRDLWLDNVLFAGDEVAAVLDFDRLHYDYPELDVARAVLSGCLREGRLDAAKVEAFLRGYRAAQPFPPGRLADAVRLLWYLESEWWIRADMDDLPRVPARFAEEMTWIASHLEALDEWDFDR